MKLDRQYLQNKAYDLVMEKLHDAGFVAYGVGGCVRDAVLGFQPNDVDVATNARPHDLPKVFGTKPWDGDSDRREGADGVVLYPTGVRHGTWTLRYGDEEVEVTSFRRDVDTDGRNATVEFADPVEEYASRRDFTMNALYVDMADNVLDPTGTGLSDLMQGRVRFVGEASERVQEDYLRRLRLFRFHARFGRGPMDVDAWNAASMYRYGLKERVSGERVWDETKKLLALHDPFEACAQMKATMVSDLFPKWDVEELGRLLVNERMRNSAPRWSRRYAALVGADIPYPCSNSERDAVAALRRAVDGPMEQSQAVVAYEYGDVVAYDWALFRGARPNHREITRGSEAVFPVTSQDLMDLGYTPGKALGDELRSLKRRWVLSDLEWTREKLLEYSKTVVRK